MGSKKSHRVQFRVPSEDESVLGWLGAQSSVSASLRVLIREYITRHGISAPTCLPVEQGARRGRPPKSDSEKVDRQINTPTIQPLATEPEVEEVAPEFDSHTSLPSRHSEMSEPEKPTPSSDNVPDPMDILGTWH